MTAAAVAPAELPRPRGRVLWQAALVLWLPTLLPPAFGMLGDCGHCATNYFGMLPVIPGVIVPVLLHLDGAWFFAAAVPPTLALWCVLYLIGREAPRWLGRLAAAAVAAGVAAQAIGLVQALRA